MLDSWKFLIHVRVQHQSKKMVCNSEKSMLQFYKKSMVFYLKLYLYNIQNTFAQKIFDTLMLNLCLCSTYKLSWEAVKIGNFPIQILLTCSLSMHLQLYFLRMSLNIHHTKCFHSPKLCCLINVTLTEVACKFVSLLHSPQFTSVIYVL